MKLLKGRMMTYAAFGVVLLSLIAAVVLIALHRNAEKGYGHTQPHEIFIKGQYSVDGGEWHDTIDGEMLHTRFRTVTVKGVFSEPLYRDEELVIFADNVFFELETRNVSIVNGHPVDPLVTYQNRPPGMTVNQTPVLFFLDETNPYMTDNQAVTLTLTYPYPMFSNADLSDCFRLYLTGTSGVYELFFARHIVSVIFCLMICFFGLFAFPIAGCVIGGINPRYWAFSLLCFFSGLYLLSKVLAPFLPLWIDDPVLCMSVIQVAGHLVSICVLIFIKVVLGDGRHKLIGNVTLLAYCAAVVAVLALSLTGRIDLYATSPIGQCVFMICAATLTVCMLREFKTNRDARLAIVTLVPPALTLLFDTANLYFGFSDIMLFEVGVAFTIVIQVLNLLYDLRQQYKETLRYQELQRELTESRVAIMVSQIQPHFLYNSLSSIAMMCTIDPETAQEATVTFADYLRGNMDSLKQKTPVPFDRELEHLKKYLYIEKLRFGKKLNIVYDIQTKDFVLPQLSVQPLAENAVKHGISKKRGGGTLTIATRETADSYQVIVSDDGKGFDVNEVKNDGRSHIGMENVRRRLKEMCGGEVTIASTVGEGTVATVTLPKEGQKRENTLC